MRRRMTNIRTAAAGCLPAAWAEWICNRRSDQADRDCQTARSTEPPNNRAAEPPLGGRSPRSLATAGLFFVADPFSRQQRARDLSAADARSCAALDRVAAADAVAPLGPKPDARLLHEHELHVRMQGRHGRGCRGPA